MIRNQDSRFSSFQEKRNWQRFSLRENFGDFFWSYTEAVFDGRFVYYGSERTDDGAHCRMLRFDTTKPFKRPSAWDIFDASAIAGRPGSFVAIAADDHFIYYGPFRCGEKANVELFQVALRYDRTKRFDTPGAWVAFDLSRVHPELGGFVGAKLINGSLYFSPYYSGDRSLFVKYDNRQAFDDPKSWSVFDALDIHPLAKGYMGVETDGQFLYFMPCYNDAIHKTNTLMLRYSLDKDFDDGNSWECFDLAAAKGNPSLGGYHGSMTFDGRYVYYSPLYAPAPSEIEARHHGWITRFDTKKPFSDELSWDVFNTRTLNSNVCGYSGAGFDGRYVYFSPVRCCSVDLHGRILRYDTWLSFGDSDAYEVFDAQSLDPALAYFDGQIAFDGLYIYFSAASRSGVMLRFCTRSLLERGRRFIASMLGWSS